jgi:hypothetical protein
MSSKYVPDEQSVQAAELAALLKVPAGQIMQSSAPSCKEDDVPSSPKYVPAAQLLHDVEPSSEVNLPLGQTAQTFSLAKFGAAFPPLLYFPGAHAEHNGEPASEKYPLSHSLQSEIESCPASLSLSGKKRPASHDVHDVTPIPENLPSGQNRQNRCTHASEETGRYFPAIQLVHDPDASLTLILPLGQIEQSFGLSWRLASLPESDR